MRHRSGSSDVRPRACTLAHFLFAVAGASIVSVGCGARTGALLALDAGPEVMTDASAIDHGCWRTSPGSRSVHPVDVEATFDALELVLLVEATGSHAPEVRALQRDFDESVVSYLRSAPVDSTTRVVAFSDVWTYGAGSLGYVQLTRADTSVARAIDAVTRLELEDGGDEPEAQVYALRRIALDAPSPWCAAMATGAECLGERGMRLVVLVTDSSFHNGPDGSSPYVLPPGSPWETPTFDEILRSLEARRIRVTGVTSGDGLALEHVVALARGTQAIDAETDDALVARVPASGVGIGTAVVGAITSALERSPLSVTLHARSDGTALSSPLPLLIVDGLGRASERGFDGVLPGSILRFAVALDVPAEALPGTRLDIDLDLVDGDVSIVRTVRACALVE